MNQGDIASYIFFAVIFIVLFFYFGRIIILWFYKINLRLKEAERTNYLLEQFLKANGIDFLPTQDGETMIEVKEKNSKTSVKVNLKTWEQMKQNYGEENYEIINQ